MLLKGVADLPPLDLDQALIRNCVRRVFKGLSPSDHQLLTALMTTGQSALADPRTLRPVRLPSAAQFAIISLSRKRRDDVLNDLCDWYPGWVQHHGRFGANLVCFMKIASAAIYEALDLLYRVGEIVGKFRGAK